MNKIIAVILFFASSQQNLSAKAFYFGVDDMIREAQVIAIVDIQQLTSTELDVRQADLIADGYIVQTYKGNLKREIQFVISRIFPCAQFDVSTGRNLVFLKEIDGMLQGVNWHKSYIHLSSKNLSWYNLDGSPQPELSETEVLGDLTRRIKCIEQGAAANP